MFRVCHEIARVPGPSPLAWPPKHGAALQKPRLHNKRARQEKTNRWETVANLDGSAAKGGNLSAKRSWNGTVGVAVHDDAVEFERPLTLSKALCFSRWRWTIVLQQQDTGRPRLQSANANRVSARRDARGNARIAAMMMGALLRRARRVHWKTDDICGEQDPPMTTNWLACCEKPKPGGGVPKGPLTVTQ